MTKPKLKQLRYTGQITEVRDDDGNVIAVQADRYFDGVPARDLKQNDLDDLGDERVKEIMGGPNPLYIDPDADKPAKKASTKKAVARARPAPKAKAKTKPEPISDPEPVADPVPEAPTDSTDGAWGVPGAE